MADSTSPQRQLLPAEQASQPVGSLAQQAFHQAMQAVSELREQLHQLRASQAATRQLYWRQVGPVAAATVAARRSLYEPLETALTGGYLNRAEEKQVVELLLHNARSLQERFGEDETTILARYAPPLPPLEQEAPAEALPTHEHAAAQARAQRRQQRHQTHTRQAQAAAEANQSLLTNTKAAYYQLARLHHPDRAAQADAATQQLHTAMMQRITATYAAGDLAALLSLLATADSPTPLSAETDELLHRYTSALAQQQVALSQQLATARRPLADAPWSGTEKQQRARLRETKRSLRVETDYLTQLVRQLREPASLPQFLRALATSGQTGI